MAYDSDVFADWWFVDSPQLMEIVAREARRVAHNFDLPDVADDLTQEGYLYLAVRPHLDGNHDGNLSLRLRRYMTDIVSKERDIREHDKVVV